VKREMMNGEGSSSTRPYIARSPTQTDFRPPYSPTTTNGSSRAQFNNPYLPQTPAPLHMPVPGPTSPMTVAAPTFGNYHSDYQSASREKPVSNYYDPTSDSGARRPSEIAARVEPQIQTPQVCGSTLNNSIPNRELAPANRVLQSREPYTYPQASSEPPKYYNGTYTSPVTSTFQPRSPISHSHPHTRPISQSPGMAPISPIMRHNGTAGGGPSIKQEATLAASVR
jgi:DNA helicase INO80